MSNIDLDANYAAANVTNGELLEIGAALMGWVTMVGRLGHTSPASTLDYTGTLDSIPALIVRDFVAWTSGRTGTVPGDPEARLKQLVQAAGWERVIVDRLDEILTDERRAS